MSSELQHSPAQIVRAVLIAMGLGTSPGSPPLPTDWPIYATTEPPFPDDCITVYDTAGIEAGRSMIDGELQGFFGIQVRVRSALPRPGWLKASTLQRKMAEDVYDEVATIEGIRYLLHCFSKIKDVLPIGKETPTSTRQLFTINAIATIKLLT